MKVAEEALREIRELLIGLSNDERRARQAAEKEGSLVPVIVGRAEDIGRPDSEGPIVQFQIDAAVSARLRGETLEQIERLVDNVLVRGAA